MGRGKLLVYIRLENESVAKGTEKGQMKKFLIYQRYGLPSSYFRENLLRCFHLKKISVSIENSIYEYIWLL